MSRCPAATGSAWREGRCSRAAPSEGLRDIGAFNIRIARDVRGAAAPLLPHIADRARRSVLSTLIVAPPQQGKTTMLRDIIRAVSYGDWPMPEARNWPARKVGVVDERSEIAACVRGVPVFDVGPRTDVLDACPKAEGMMMLLRSMSPELLAADEIGRPEDADAIREAAHAGVPVIATAHAGDLQDARGRTAIRRLLDEGAFAAVVELRRRGAATDVPRRAADSGGARADRACGRRWSMLKLAGAILVLLSGTLIGFRQAARYADRTAQIRQLIHALQRLETEIGFGHTPLPEALERPPRARRNRSPRCSGARRRGCAKAEPPSATPCARRSTKAGP